MDSNHRSVKQQIYSLSPLATRELLHIQLPTPTRDPDQIEAQRSGFDLERRSDEVSELSRLRGSEGCEVHDDVELVD